MTSPERHRSHWPLADGRAAAWMLSSALSFSLMGVCVKAVGSRIPVAEVVLARSAVSLVLSVLMLRQAELDPWGRRRGLLVLRGVIGTAALLCVFTALTQLPLAPATVLQYLQPTFTALLAWLLLPLSRSSLPQPRRQQQQRKRRPKRWPACVQMRQSSSRSRTHWMTRE